MKRQIFTGWRTRTAALMTCILLPGFLIAYTWFMNHRPRLHVRSEWGLMDTLIQNSDLFLAVLFLVVSTVPFYLVFDKRKAQARDLAPIALMGAMCVVGRSAFAIVPLPNFKPVTAIVMITAIAFGPESGYLTGALAALLSNFLFGQGPWTPWQMFSWGIIGFLTGVLYKAGIFGSVEQTTVDRRGRRKKPVRLCIFGFFCGVLYGWIMNLQYISGYIRPINLTTVTAAYISSFWFDISHGACTAIVLWLAAEPWVRKLLRIKKKFGLNGGETRYVMPPAEAESQTGGTI